MESTGFTQAVGEGVELATACQAEVVISSESLGMGESVDGIPEDRGCQVKCTVDKVTVSCKDKEREEKLVKMIEEPDLPDSERAELYALLAKHHNAFSLELGESGETDLTLLEIDTGDERPRRQPVRRVPFAVRQQIADLLAEMQRDGVKVTLGKPCGACPEKGWESSLLC